MAKQTKKINPRLYDVTHEFVLGGMDSNCYMTVIGEFAGGHEGQKTFKGKRLTNNEWLAVCKRSCLLSGLVFFGGVKRTIEEAHPFGQEAFRLFLERNGVKVSKVSNDTHIGYLCFLTPKFMDKVKAIKADAYYTSDPADDWESDDSYF